jgi:alpha-galactosidase/6-phospho-beta-glucosidase family protein
VISQGKSLVAFQIEPNAAEEVRQILDSVTTSFKDFDLVIQAFDPTARKAREVDGRVPLQIAYLQRDFVSISRE